MSIDEILDREDLPLRPAKFTEEEAKEYFAVVFKEHSFTIVDTEWDWFSVQEWEDEPAHRESALNVYFKLGSDHVCTFVIWMEPHGLYGEW